ncbi:PREDICTED: paxillin isoform X3 [Nicrophorus vespilloides]|uniref:Paxillin isoform X3 n=1 Tax=Nicrophorus vespilloides TaxID=110193 RepID=A0ABM1MLC9_NICVS|nr:PREDICTED: paxillin isoform X3 [Nicrophorus vespilloides]
MYKKDALLADLQNTVAPSSTVAGSSSPGYGSLKHPRSSPSAAATPPPTPPSAPTAASYEIRHDTYATKTGTYGRTQPTSGGRSPVVPPKKPFSNNLSELDSLLQDLSTANESSGNAMSANIIYANQTVGSNGSAMNGHEGGSGGDSPAAAYTSRPSSQTANRPTVDSLLDELNAGEVFYQGPRKVTITVKETKTEAGYPGETELVTRHVSQVRSTPPPAASNATRELDDLMDTLSEIKVSKQTVSDSVYARPEKAAAQKQNLDHMLGNLQADMSRQGVNTSQKGCCSACEKPIVGQVITALGKTWHPEHFTCSHCTQELGTRNFFERDGKPYCENDYHNLFSPRCAYCNGPILDKCVTALEKTWHMEHFFCAQCGKQFGDEGFHEREGKPYCRDDYFDMFAPKCGACNRAIMENYISALNAQWHPDCFVCRDCKQAVQGKSFYAVEGKPVCPKCIGVDEEEEEEEE